MASWPRQQTTGRATAGMFPLLALCLVAGAACGGGSGSANASGTAPIVSVGPTDTTIQAGGPPQTPLTGPLQTAPTTRPDSPLVTAPTNGADIPRPSAPTTGSVSSPLPTTSTTRPKPLPTTSTTRPDDAYLPVGVVDQIFPPGTKAFELLATGECGPLLRQIENAEAPTTATWSEGNGVPDQLTLLYSAAAHACLAQWSIAQTDFQQVKQPIDCGFTETAPNMETAPNWSSSFETAADCQMVRNLVYSWTKGLLTAHQSDPSFVPHFPTQPES